MGRYVYLPRDERGWRVPTPGSVASDIYHLLVKGARPRDIALQLKVNPNLTNQLIFQIRKPDQANAAVREVHRRKAQRRRLGRGGAATTHR